MSELRCPWCSGVAYVPSSPGDTVFRWWCRSSTNECNATGPERPTEAEARADCEVVMVDRELYGVLPDPISEVEIYRAAVALLVGDMAVEGEWPDPEAARKWALKEARALAAAVKEGE